MGNLPGWAEFFLNAVGGKTPERKKDFDLSDPQSSGHVNRKRRKREGLSNKKLNKGSGQKRKPKKKDEGRPISTPLVTQLAGEPKQLKKEPKSPRKKKKTQRS